MRDTFNSLSDKRRFWKQANKVGLFLIIVPPLFGMICTGYAMVTHFRILGGESSASKGTLANDIRFALGLTSIGVTISALGLVLLIISILRGRSLQKS